MFTIFGPHDIAIRLVTIYTPTTFSPADFTLTPTHTQMPFCHMDCSMLIDGMVVV